MDSLKNHTVFDENDWTDIVAWDCNAYVKSKAISERSAWDFKTEQEKLGNYCPEIVTLCPATIFGEVICSGD